MKHEAMLILDERSVASSRGVTFHLNQATKHPENPVLIPGEPQEWDSLQICWPGSVHYDAGEGKFRCWYHGLNAVQSERIVRDPHLPWEAGYAESDDGLHWTKPKLDLMPYRDVPCNRITTDFEGWMFNCVFPNPDVSDHERRFLSIWKTQATYQQPKPMEFALASSPDGLSWTLAERTLFVEPSSRIQRQDFWQILFDPDAPADYRCLSYIQVHDPRKWDDRNVRQVGLQHGPDLRHLSNADPLIILEPEEGIDEEIHFCSVARLGGAYLMLFESDRFLNEPIRGDMRLAVSEDGRSFRRVHAQQPLVPTGAKGSWDENLLVNTNYSMQEVGDEVWIYYFGCPTLYRRFPSAYAASSELRGSLYYPSYMGVATLPRDRFGYATGDGSITSKPIDLHGDDLWLNADGDALQVELLADDDSVVAEASLTDERDQTVYRKVDGWNQVVAPGRYRVRVTLGTDSKLFSIRWGA